MTPDTLSNPFVLGYHGCHRDVAEQVLSGQAQHLKVSDNAWDWLGTGIYFWEADPVRGFEWAVSRYGETDAAVVGAVIHLGHCLNLLSRRAVMVLEAAYESFLIHHERSYPDKPLPENRLTPKGPSHALDCAVINHLHYLRETMRPQPALPYNTVRGLYQEGGSAFHGSRLMAKTHVQVCVRTPAESIVGYFRVPPEHWERPVAPAVGQ